MDKSWTDIRADTKSIITKVDAWLQQYQELLVLMSESTGVISIKANIDKLKQIDQNIDRYF